MALACPGRLQCAWLRFTLNRTQAKSSTKEKPVFRTNRWGLTTCLALAVVLGGLLSAASAAEKSPAARPCRIPSTPIAWGSAPTRSPPAFKAQLELAPMLAELGYAGMAHVGLDGAIEMLEALEKHNQKLFAVYTDLVVDPGDRGYDPQLKRAHPEAQRARHHRVAGGQQQEVQAVVDRRRRARRRAAARDRRDRPAIRRGHLALSAQGLLRRADGRRGAAGQEDRSAERRA